MVRLKKLIVTIIFIHMGMICSSVGMNNNQENDLSPPSRIRTFIYSNPIDLRLFNSSNSCSFIPAACLNGCTDAHEIVKTNMEQIQLYCLKNIVLPARFFKLRTYKINVDFFAPIIQKYKNREYPILNFNLDNVLTRFVSRMLTLTETEKLQIRSGILNSDIDDLVDLTGSGHLRSNSFFATATMFAVITNTVLSVKNYSNHPFFTWLHQNYDSQFNGIQMVTLSQFP